jgi:peptidoglycan hydrolase CwlO-like protein
MVNLKLIKISIISLLIFGFLLPIFFGSAQEVTEDNSTTTQLALTSSEERKILEEELKQLEEQILQYEGDISRTEAEKRTLQNQIYILKKRIDKLDLQIYQSNVMIKDIGFQIEDTGISIEQTSFAIEDSRKQLAVILRTIYEEDQKSLIEILLSEEEISGFFDNLMALEALNAKNKELLDNIKDLKSYLEGQKYSLDEERADLERAVKIQLLQRQESASTKIEKDYYLKLTETEYQKQLGEKTAVEKKAAEIRARIFELIGVKKAPTFGEAYEIAKYVSGITGVRPALLLAVLKQESNIGNNVGQCYLADTTSGTGIRIKNGQQEPRTMKPTRDLPHFLNICESLGRDPLNTPVSCPLKDKWGNPVGWGGAMGPAQFIPDTWANPKYGYSQKVKEVTGKEADPWDIRDAFLAAGLYLKDVGALDNEFKAVMRYFSGYRWSRWEEFYGRSVLKFASGFEEDIKELERY